MSEPTNGEVMRRLDEVARQLVGLAEDMRIDRNNAADTYARKDVQERVDAGQDRRLDVIERDDAQRERDQVNLRRQLVVGLVLVAVPALVGLLLGVNRLLATGGVAP